MSKCETEDFDNVGLRLGLRLTDLDTFTLRDCENVRMRDCVNKSENRTMRD